MALQESDLQKLLDDVEEARKLLAEKAKVERELQQAKKTLDKLRIEAAAKEQHLENVQAKIAHEESRFEHEKARYAQDLESHLKGCEKKKKEADVQVASVVGDVDVQIEKRRVAAEGEKRVIDQGLVSLRTERNRIAFEIGEFKRKIASLPE